MQLTTPQMRPTLTLKKRPATLLQPSASEPTVPAAPVPAPPPKAAPKKPGKAELARLAREAIKAENIKRGSEQAAKRAADRLRLEPVVLNYLKSLAIIKEPVEIDGQRYFRPLMRRVDKRLNEVLRQMPEGAGCSNSLMHDMTTEFLEAHVTQRDYLQGMLYFKKRFDLEGTVVEDISPKHLKSAQNRLAKLTGTEVS
ncbi:MAG: hypothetical protein KIG95_03195 [Comamonas sp.]|nr:hypothetical protein [Comamonas sp.]